MTLFALHGFAGRPDFLAPLEAAAAGAPLLAPALAGHGPTPLPPTTFEDEVARLTAIARGAASGVVVYGYSLGARLGVGVAAALAAEGRLRGAVFVGLEPGLADADRAGRVVLDDDRARALLDDGVEVFLEEWVAQPLFATQRRLPEALRRARADARAAHTATGLAAALRAFSPGRMPDLRPRLRALDAPVTFVAGALDGKFVERAHDACVHAPRGRVVVVPEAGHDVLLEAEEAMLALVRAVFDSEGSPT